MPSLQSFAELRLERDDKLDDVLEISFNYTGAPDHSEKQKQKLKKICVRLLNTQIPSVYSVLENVQSYDDPDTTDVVLQRKNLKDSHITWLMYHLKRGFEMRAISKKDMIHTIIKCDFVGWVKTPKSGFCTTAERAVKAKKISSRKRKYFVNKSSSLHD